MRTKKKKRRDLTFSPLLFSSLFFSHARIQQKAYHCTHLCMQKKRLFSQEKRETTAVLSHLRSIFLSLSLSLFSTVMNVIALMVLLCGVSVSTAAPTVLHVSAFRGSAQGCGSETQPFSTVFDALAAIRGRQEGALMIDPGRISARALSCLRGITYREKKGRGSLLLRLVSPVSPTKLKKLAVI